jgi:hypothetical protein
MLIARTIRRWSYAEPYAGKVGVCEVSGKAVSCPPV